MLHGFSTYSLGYSFGSLIGTFLLCSFFALLFWFILRKKENAASNAFNIVLTFILLNSFTEIGEIITNKKNAVDELKQSIKEYKTNALTSPDSIDNDFLTLTDNIDNSLNTLIKSSIGDEKRVYLALKSFTEKSAEINNKWNEAYNNFNDPRIFDITLLNNEKEFVFQKEVIYNYIDKSQVFLKFFQNRINYLRGKTANIDPDNPTLIGVLRGVANRDSVQRPIFIPYIEGHINYGKIMIQILNLLEKENPNWKYLDEVIEFQNPKSQAKYNQLIEEATNYEGIINEMSDKFIELI